MVPTHIDPVEGVKIDIFRAPGARISNFNSNQTLARVLNYPYDLTILFFGGNDMHNNCIPSVNFNNIQNVIEQIHSYCNSHICFVILEHRNLVRGNWFNIDTDQYNKVVNNINNRLKRKYKNKSYVQFLSITAKPFQQGVVNGIHFNRVPGRFEVEIKKHNQALQRLQIINK